MNKAEQEGVGQRTVADAGSAGITLGYPFDQLFDRNCCLESWSQPSLFVPAIKLPCGSFPGTGNIVICGPPGSGKSTLALQWAAKCALRNDNKSNAVYFSLENSVDELISKARAFGWHHWLREIRLLKAADEFGNPEDLVNPLCELLLGESNGIPLAATGQHEAIDFHEAINDQITNGGDNTRRVLVGSLSPRFVPTDQPGQDLFWRRYYQLERLLRAAQYLSENGPVADGPKGTALVERWKTAWVLKTGGLLLRDRARSAPVRPVLPLVVVDSLNMFGTQLLSRDETFHLFNLFRKYQRIGLFVVESSQDTPFDSTMADVVVSLTSEHDRGYLVHHFQIEKSRYFNQVTGLHGYKSLSFPPPLKVQMLPPLPGQNALPSEPRKGLVVYPSLHYLVLRTERTAPAGVQNESGSERIGEPAYFGIKAFESILPTNLTCGSVITIEGPRGTFKTSFALNLLGSGLRRGESGLLIRLNDTPLLTADEEGRMRPPLMSQDLADCTDPPFNWNEWKRWGAREIFDGSWDALAGLHKMRITLWRKNKDRRWKIKADAINSPDQLAGMLVAKRGAICCFLWDHLAPKNGISLQQLHEFLKSLAEDPRAELRPSGLEPPSAWRKVHEVLADSLNSIVQGPNLWTKSPFAQCDISSATRDLIEPSTRSRSARRMLNRCLLAEAFPAHLGFYEPTLFEMDFKGGMLLPEEFMDIVRNVFIRRVGGRSIRRVVLDDVSQIGVSYPFLRQSTTTGDIFLSAFVHIMRNFGVDLVMTGTTGGLASAEEAVKRACSLADTVVSCRYSDIFGQQQVVVRGERLMTGKNEVGEACESAPAVVRVLGKDGSRFSVDTEHLKGLVGFEKGEIHRPGVTIHLFEENDLIHREYNKHISKLLETGLGSAMSGRAAGVSVKSFRSQESEAVHDSLDLLPAGAPLDTTVIFTVDEFGGPVSESANKVTHKKYRDSRAHFVAIGGPQQTTRHNRGPARAQEAEDLLKEDFAFFKGDAYPDGDRAKPENQNTPPLAWPYYSNVLLIAYRRDLDRHKARVEGLLPRLLSNRKPLSWKNVLEASQLILEDFSTRRERRRRVAKSPDVLRAFWTDLSAKETLSCLLMDVLISPFVRDRPMAGKTIMQMTSSQRLKVRGRLSDILHGRTHSRLTTKQRDQIHALCRLFSAMGEVPQELKSVLAPDAGVYVCWYSQLRELIERVPDLAPRLDICPLPGRGFTGDWFVGVVKGSVSPALGENFIRSLCSKEEDYRRFVLGVGLPARSVFYQETEQETDQGPCWFSWPRGTHVPLARLKSKIHNAAWSRLRDIEGYQDFKAVLWRLTRQLTSLDGPVSVKRMDLDKAVAIVQRVFAQMQQLGSP